MWLWRCLWLSHLLLKRVWCSFGTSYKLFVSQNVPLKSIIKYHLIRWVYIFAWTEYFYAVFEIDFRITKKQIPWYIFGHYTILYYAWNIFDIIFKYFEELSSVSWTSNWYQNEYKRYQEYAKTNTGVVSSFPCYSCTPATTKQPKHVTLC